MNEHLGRRKKETLCAEARGSAQGGGGGEEGIDSLPSPMVLAKFALPTLAMRLATPLLSLVDSAVVGKFGTAAQLAALSPGTIACDSSAYVLTFLGIATTNLYATALAEGRADEAARVLNNALALAVICGTILSLAIFFLAPAFLTSFTGAGAGEVLVGAKEFAKIRALGTPAAILTMVAQALCFGEKDAITPLKTVLISFVINLVGALGLVCFLPNMIMAVAVATVVAQWAGALFILQRVARQQRALEQEGGQQPGASETSWRRRSGLLRITVPGMSALRDFLTFAGPGFFALLGKVICYSSMSYAAAAAGTLSLAAHQVVMQVFFFFCNIGDSISNTAQAFLPALFSKGKREATLQVIKSIFLVGSVIGLVDGMLAATVPVCFSGMFTSSLEVQQRMLSVAAYLVVSLALHANVVALEGVLFAARESRYLALAYAASTTVFTAAMVVARNFSPTLFTVWSALVLYQVVRLLQFGFKVAAITAIPPSSSSSSSSSTSEGSKNL